MMAMRSIALLAWFSAVPSVVVVGAGSDRGITTGGNTWASINNAYVDPSKRDLFDGINGNEATSMKRLPACLHEVEPTLENSTPPAVPAKEENMLVANGEELDASHFMAKAMLSRINKVREVPVRGKAPATDADATGVISTPVLHRWLPACFLLSLAPPMAYQHARTLH
jgi:hypothetical protein